MHPTLVPGDHLLVRLGARPTVGSLVVLRPPNRSELLVVKRVIRAVEEGWWVEGDNASGSDDSRLFGSVNRAAVLGRVLWRYWPVIRRTGGSSVRQAVRRD